MDHIQLWDAIKEELRQKIAPGMTFESYVEGLTPLSLVASTNGTNLYLSTPHKNVADDWNTPGGQYYSQFIAAALQASATISGTPTVILPVVTYIDQKLTTTPIQPESTSTQEPTSNVEKQMPESSKLNPKFRFDTFIASTPNREAKSVAEAIAEHPGEEWNPLLLYGNPGLGKTHLMQAIGNELLRRNPKADVKFITTDDFMNDWTDALRFNKQNEFKDKYRNVDLLLVDDIQSLAGKENVQEEFFNTFNAITRAGNQIVLTADKLPKDIKGIEDRLVSRFAMGYPANLTQPDSETKIAILKNKAEEMNIEISYDVLSEIANAVDTNVRELEGVFKRVVARIRFSNDPVTVESIREILAGLDFERTNIISIEMIQDAVAKYFNVTTTDLIGKSRVKEIVIPRQIAMYLSREITQESLPAIGRAFGGKDHTTVMHSTSKIEEAVLENKQLEAQMQEIRATLQK
ncbi:chromosomal replication initiator protein DnaA [Weissella diestrammenae]|uniref:Chromosomal replication initiator protein DnaA n=1 Tax=Weissella diestrammenae TaxID=1162633 RepID=A0A7G9T785_9LACO|nr:chromosomal replication initiator protein DnaA [Weissella diestrammenae]MCM0582436.1 chromosomal replication initiator protein DnaA [Weissella diestrammenae]QNN75960.1 chromosomal replication initiator protein DnaA [Weissella diestrammenae]